MELATNDDVMGTIGRLYVDVQRSQNDAFRQQLDANIRQGIEAQVEQTSPLAN